MHSIFKLIVLLFPRVLQIGVPLFFLGWLLVAAMHAGPSAQAQAAAMIAHAYSRH